MHAKSGLRVFLDWEINRPDSVITAVITLMKNLILLAITVSILGCSDSSADRNDSWPSPSASTSSVAPEVLSGTDLPTTTTIPLAAKNDASPDGLDAAKRDVEKFKNTLAAKQGDELIASLVAKSKTTTYGGYDYYYGYMANQAVIDEIRSRDDGITIDLKNQQNNRTRIAEAVNGRGQTVGGVCTSEIYRRESKTLDK